jgi:hypothetical protein
MKSITVTDMGETTVLVASPWKPGKLIDIRETLPL